MKQNCKSCTNIEIKQRTDLYKDYNCITYNVKYMIEKSIIYIIIVRFTRVRIVSSFLHFYMKYDVRNK